MGPRVAAVAALAGTLVLSACAGLQAPADERAAAPLRAPAAWQASLAPHQGQVSELTQWWAQFQDPLLDQLLAAAQELSPSVASAGARIAQARASLAGTQAALGPTVNAVASGSRGRPDVNMPVSTSLGAGLQAQWEIDLFGGVRASHDAARERLLGSTAAWHEARVAVAAEVANQYTALRACEAQVEQSQLDTRSRSETARLTELAARAGFQAPASAALARASAAQGQSQLTQQRARCDLAVKGLVALTGIDEPGLRLRLAAGRAHLPLPAQLVVPAVPAQLLAQRPDVEAAAREVLAAGADITQTRAQRLPRITLGGSLGAARFSGAGGSSEGSTWNIGPVTVTLPLYDGGGQTARVVAAQARHAEAQALYAARVRTAVREVEDALVELQSSADRNADARIASEGFAASFLAAQARYQGGLASLFELEDARRSAVQAQASLIDLQRERVGAWIALYRALGGGWTADASAPEPERRGTAP
jgi:NodT family efflux transporter outer membrane factor (OMF) lipoprotein